MIWFALGDHRDQPRFLAPTGSNPEYTSSPSRAIDKQEALTPEQLQDLIMANRQRDTGRRAQTSATLAREPLAKRMARLEHRLAVLPSEARKYVEWELKIILDRLRHAEKRHKNR